MNTRRSVLLTALAVTLALLSTSCRGQSVIKRLPRTTKDITYATVGGQPMHLDRYVPSGSGPWPGILLIHGGAWSLERFTKDGPDIVPVAKALAKSGFLVAVPDYRLAPEFPYPAAVRDLQRALDWLVSQPDVIEDDVATIGGSAGGHLAALLALTGDSVGAWVGMSGVYDFNETMPPALELAVDTFLGSNDSRALRAEASPITYVGSDDIPAYMTNFRRDVVGLGKRPAVPSGQMREMASALRAAGVSVETDLVPRAGHAFSAWRFVGADVLDWLSRTL
jgi:acetyl esterase/lipase